jgi:predicted RNase H-like nuclease (RuvC/YqgF family)
MLRVSKVPPGDPTTEDYVGQNRFECLTCPYQFVINKRYYERKYMKKKEVEDILGGKGAWDNVDKTQGTFAKPSADHDECNELAAEMASLEIKVKSLEAKKKRLEFTIKALDLEMKNFETEIKSLETKKKRHDFKVKARDGDREPRDRDRDRDRDRG